MLPAPLAPDVPADELERRMGSLRREMAGEGIDALVLTAQKNIEYLTDYRSLSWTYNARPLLALVDQRSIVLVASRSETRNLESARRGFSWVFYDGYLAEAAQALAALFATAGGRRHLAIDYGQDMFGRGSLALIDGLRGYAAKEILLDGTSVLWRTRMIKSRFEASLKSMAFEIANAAFDTTVAAARQGMTEIEFNRRLQAEIIINGADRADPIATVFGRDEFIYNRPPGARALRDGDYVWTDFRSTYGGYPADRNRIARAGEPEAWEREIWRSCRDLTVELAGSARTGMSCGELFGVYQKLWRDAGLPAGYSLVARIGHGGGLDVTEPPSIGPDSHDEIRPGMILHLEPKLELRGAVFQFEEVIYVGETGAEFLSDLSPGEIPVIV